MKIKSLINIGLVVALGIAGYQYWQNQKPESVSFQPAAMAQTERVSSPTPASAVNPDPTNTTLLDASGEMLATLETGNPIKITMGKTGQVLKATSMEKEKRKYKQVDGSLAYEIKEKDQGFKLRNPQSALLWKVKFSDSDKIKISDNEEGEHPVVLKTHSASVTVEDDGVLLGEARFDSDKKETRITDASGGLKYLVKSGKASAGFGLLLSTRISREDASVLVAELLLHAR